MSDSSEVPWFDRDRIPPGHWLFLSTILNSLRLVRSELIKPSVDLTEGLEGVTITGCLEAYRQIILRRALDLALSVVVTWNAGFGIGAVVSARALLETLAAFHDLLADASALADNKDWAAIGALVDARAWSTSNGPNRTTGKRDGSPRIGRQVTRFVRAIEPNAELFWHQISDISHPNGAPMFRHFSVLVDGQMNERPVVESEPQLFQAIYNCLYAVCWLYGTAMSDFDKLLDRIRYLDIEPS